jgi:hypothetical protein
MRSPRPVTSGIEVNTGHVVPAGYRLNVSDGVAGYVLGPAVNASEYGGRASRTTSAHRMSTAKGVARATSLRLMCGTNADLRRRPAWSATDPPAGAVSRS